MIEMSVLAQLVAFADCGTLSAAAEKLHTSQPAVTRAMKKLEEELGLSLFARSKNHLALNEVGELAVRHARRILQETADMTELLRAYERSLRTISIAFCSLLPQIVLTPLLNNVFEGMTLSADMKDDADFFAKLKDRTYQLTVTHTPPEDANVFHAKKCGHEDLFLSLPTMSPLAFHPRLQLDHLNGETLLLLNRVGFWMKAVHEKTPQTRYLMQEERTTLTELAANSPYPIFQSGYFIARGEAIEGRISIPLADPECHTDYWLVCLKEDLPKYRRLFDKVTEKTIA